MTRAGIRLPLALAAIGVVVGTLQAIVAVPLPGDVALTRALQGAFGAEAGWAAWLTDTAKAPLLWATLAVAMGLAWIGAGWRAVPVPPMALLLAHALDRGLRALVFVPRPSADVVAVVSASASSGLPSTFGLVYGALFGGLLAGFAARTATPRVLAAFVVALLLAGMAARVVPGGHWPSQVLASLGVSAAIALAVRRALAAR